MNQSFLFRELDGEDELERFFRKRYVAYFSSAQRPLLLKEDGIDLDVYDLHSRHYGIFHGNEPAGYFRIILGKSSYYNEQVFRIGLRNNRYSETIHHRENVGSADYPEFYFMELFNDQLQSKNGLSRYFNSVDQMVEPSRIVLFDNYKNLRLARAITECALVLYNELCISTAKEAIISCFENHAIFYQAYGFNVLRKPLSNPLITNKHDALLSLPYADTLETSSIPSNLHPKILTMTEQWESEGKITLSPAISKP